MLLAIVALLALTRAELVQRVRAPTITQANGLVQVFANCSEAMRREYQLPVARFAANTVSMLYTGLSQDPQRFEKPGILLLIGDERTNTTEIVTRVETNGNMRIVSRLFIKNPSVVDLESLRMEIARAFFRSVQGVEAETESIRTILRRADPSSRIADERAKLEAWLAGKGIDDEEGFLLMRKVLTPGVASRRDVLIFASRLYLYPRTFAEKFVGGYDGLSFQDAIKFAKIDIRVRILAYLKAQELPVWAGGRGKEMDDAAERYCEFLLELARGEKTEDELETMLKDADERLKQVLEKAK